MKGFDTIAMNAKAAEHVRMGHAKVFAISAQMAANNCVVMGHKEHYV
jgi:hypothetical protein